MESEINVRAVARLRLAVVRLARQIRQNARSGVTPSQLSALATLDRHGPMRLADLADHEGVARSTITRLVRQLDEDGLITRQGDPHDGRSTIATLSPAGHTLLTDARERAQAFLVERIAGLPDMTAEQVNEVAALLERVAVRGHQGASDVAATAPAHGPSAGRPS